MCLKVWRGVTFKFKGFHYVQEMNRFSGKRAGWVQFHTAKVKCLLDSRLMKIWETFLKRKEWGSIQYIQLPRNNVLAKIRHHIFTNKCFLGKLAYDYRQLNRMRHISKLPFLMAFHPFNFEEAVMKKFLLVWICKDLNSLIGLWVCPTTVFLIFPPPAPVSFSCQSLTLFCILVHLSFPSHFHRLVLNFCPNCCVAFRPLSIHLSLCLSLDKCKG